MLEGIKGLSVQALVLGLIHIQEGSARSEVQVLTNYELLADSKRTHYL